MKTSSLVLLACLTIAALAPFAKADPTPQESAAANSVYVGPDIANGHPNMPIEPCTTNGGSVESYFATPLIQHVGTITVGHRYVTEWAFNSGNGAPPLSFYNHAYMENETGQAWTVTYDTSPPFAVTSVTDNDPSTAHDVTLVRDEVSNSTLLALWGTWRMTAVAWTALPGDDNQAFSYLDCEASFGRTFATGWSSIACGPEQSTNGASTRAVESTPGYAGMDTSANQNVWEAHAWYFDVTNLTGSEATSCSPSAVDCFTITSNLAAPFAFSPFQDVLTVAAILGGAVALVVLIVAPRRPPNNDEDENGDQDGEGAA